MRVECQFFVIQHLIHPTRPVFFMLAQSFIATSSSQKIGTPDALKKINGLA